MPVKVIVDDRFDIYAAQARRATERALGRAAAVGVAAARSKPSRYRIDQIKGSVKAGPVGTNIKFRGGLAIPIYAGDWRAIFFELGTLRRRRKKLSRSTVARRQSASGRAKQQRVADAMGVRPQRFLSLGLRRAKEQLPLALEQEIGRLR